MLVSTGLLVQSAMAGLVADAPTETLRTGCLARERERARSTGNGLTYLARDTDARLCEMRALPARILMRRPAYSLAVKPDLRYFRTQIIHEVLIIIGFSAQLPQPPRGLAGMKRPPGGPQDHGFGEDGRQRGPGRAGCRGPAAYLTDGDGLPGRRDIPGNEAFYSQAEGRVSRRGGPADRAANVALAADFFFVMYQGEESKSRQIEDPAPNPPA